MPTTLVLVPTDLERRRLGPTSRRALAEFSARAAGVGLGSGDLLDVFAG